MFQDFVRYEVSLADNVTFRAADHATDEAGLRDVAQAAGVAPLVDSLPSGWDTILSRRFPGGHDLSGGEWQRVALARALYAARA